MASHAFVWSLKFLRARPVLSFLKRGTSSVCDESGRNPLFFPVSDLNFSICIDVNREEHSSMALLVAGVLFFPCVEIPDAFSHPETLVMSALRFSAPV